MAKYGLGAALNNCAALCLPLAQTSGSCVHRSSPTKDTAVDCVRKLDQLLWNTLVATPPDVAIRLLLQGHAPHTVILTFLCCTQCAWAERSERGLQSSIAGYQTVLVRRGLPQRSVPLVANEDSLSVRSLDQSQR